MKSNINTLHDLAAHEDITKNASFLQCMQEKTHFNGLNMIKETLHNVNI